MDDDGIVRSGLRRLRETQGFEVVTVASAEAALHRVRSLAAEVVIMDTDTPGMSGRRSDAPVVEKAPARPC